MGHTRRTSSTAHAPAGHRVRLWGSFRVKQTIRSSRRSPRTRMGDARVAEKPHQRKPFRGTPHPRGKSGRHSHGLSVSMAPAPVQKSNPSTSSAEMRDCPASMRKTSRLWARAPRDSAANLSMPFPTTAQPEQYPPIAFRIILDAILPATSAAVNSATPPDRALLRFPAKGKLSPAFSSPIPQQYPAWPSPPPPLPHPSLPRTPEPHFLQQPI